MKGGGDVANEMKPPVSMFDGQKYYWETDSDSRTLSAYVFIHSDKEINQWKPFELKWIVRVGACVQEIPALL